MTFNNLPLHRIIIFNHIRFLYLYNFFERKISNLWVRSLKTWLLMGVYFFSWEKSLIMEREPDFYLWRLNRYLRSRAWLRGLRGWSRCTYPKTQQEILFSRIFLPSVHRSSYSILTHIREKEREKEKEEETKKDSSPAPSSPLIRTPFYGVVSLDGIPLPPIYTYTHARTHESSVHKRIECTNRYSRWRVIRSAGSVNGPRRRREK